MRVYSIYNHMWKFILMVAVVIGFFSRSVCANNSSYYDKDGSSVIPIENKNIRMKKEIVKIRADRNEHGKWLADCEFIFVNKSESEEPVTMGYPDWLNSRYDPKEDKSFWNYFESLSEKTKKNYREGAFIVGYGYDEVYITGYKEGKLHYITEAWNLRDLKVLINGREAIVTHRPIDIKIEVSKADEKKFAAQPMPPSGAFIWKMLFKPKETIIVRVTFSFSGLTDVGGIQQVSYLLRTGALWADTIGTADIYWNTTGRLVSQARVTPPTQTVEGDVLHWHFDNYKPTEDIVLFADMTDYVNLMSRAFRSKKYEGNTRKYTSRDLQSTIEGSYPAEKRLYIKTLRNEIYARHGRVFRSEDLKEIFSGCDWYRANELFSENMLNEYEKYNVQFLLNNEKQLR